MKISVFILFLFILVSSAKGQDTIVVSAPLESKIKDTIVIDQKFDYLYRRENGDFVAVIVNDDGTTTETDVYPDKTPAQTLITDGQGDSVVVSQKGQVMGIKEYRATGGNRALLNDYHRKSDSLAQWQINFLPDTATQIYGFDYLGSGSHGIYSGSEYYPYLSGNYDLRFKSVECGKTDKVIVDFGSYPEKDSVVFKDKWGVKLKVSKGNILNFSGVTDADTNYIYAYRGDKKIGKLSVNTYKKKSYKVVLVRVNKATLPDINELEKYLGKVYRQSVDSIEIDTAYFYFPELLILSHGGSPWNSVYNDDQKRVLRAYDKKMQDGVYYLFFIDNVLDKKDGNGTLVSGYMPRGYNAGFIYDGGSPHTIAHELGHGIAGLEHVFENSKSSGKTKNLMDYASGTQLWHFQWDEIQDPSRVWMKWSKDESEGEDKINITDKCGVYALRDVYSEIHERGVENPYYNVKSSFIKPLSDRYPYYFQFENSNLKTAFLIFQNINVVKELLDKYTSIGCPILLLIRENNTSNPRAFAKNKPSLYLSSGRAKIGEFVYTDKLDTSEILKIKKMLVEITVNTSKFVNNDSASVIADMLVILGHEFFIHDDDIYGSFLFADNKVEGYKKFSTYSGPENGIFDHQDYIQGKKDKMNLYIKQLKEYIPKISKYEWACGVSLDHIEKAIKQHNSYYNDLKYKKNYREAYNKGKLKVNGEIRR